MKGFLKQTQGGNIEELEMTTVDLAFQRLRNNSYMITLRQDGVVYFVMISSTKPIVCKIMEAGDHRSAKAIKPSSE